MSTGFSRDTRTGDNDLAADPTRGFVPFPAERAQKYRRAGLWSGRPLDSILRDAAATWPDKPAVIDADGSYTFAELDAVADRVAAGLERAGHRPR